MLRKVILTAAALFLIQSQVVLAQDTGPRRGYGGQCPAGSCANNGGPRARDVKNCSPKNCKSGAPLYRGLGS